jgi:hypothetical protein
MNNIYTCIKLRIKLNIWDIMKKLNENQKKGELINSEKISKYRLKFNFDKCLYEEQIIFLKSEFILFKFHQLFLYELKTCELKNVYFFDLFDSIIKISKINNEQFLLLSFNKILIVQLKNNNN